MYSAQFLLLKSIAYSIFLVGANGQGDTFPCNKIYSGWVNKIHSPNYPQPYPSSYSCTYYPVSPEENVMLNITIEDLDLEQDLECLEHTMGSCCTRTWLSIPMDDISGSRTMLQVCGNNETLRHRVFTVANPRDPIRIKFHSLGNHIEGRGFRLSYKFFPVSIPDVMCEKGQYKCDNNSKCVAHNWLCDGHSQCVDGTDEEDCLSLPYEFKIKKSESRCQSIDEADCGPLDPGCYDNKTQRCDGHRDCRQSGLDEDGCEGCQKGTMPCSGPRGCYHISDTCDGIPHCQDFTDETDCDYCPTGQAICSLRSPQCFSPFIDRCNGKLDCPSGEDEVGCDPMCKTSIACADGQGCYTSAQRCNLVMNCADGSDEMHCQRELHFECQTGGRSISVRLWCDGVDDCGDGSDERGCIKNSVITAAIMGSLLCGLLLVVAVGCTCRLYSLSMKGLVSGSNNSNGSTSSPHHSSSPVLAPAPPSSPRHNLPPMAMFPGDDEFYFREPPPAYSVAVGECPPSPCPPYSYSVSSITQPRIHSGHASAAVPVCERVVTRAGGRRSRRSSSNRRPSPSAQQPRPGSIPLAMPLPPYSAAPQRPLPLPPYTPPQDFAGSSSTEVPVYAPPPSTKVMESLLQSLGRGVSGSCGGEVSTESEAAALVGMDRSASASPSPSPSRSLSSSHESIAV